MPSRTHREQLAHRSQLTAGCDAAHIRDVNPDEVQQPILDHRDDLVGRGVQFTHCDWRGTLSPYHSEILVIFGAEEIFKKEELEAFDFLGKPDPEDRRNPLMHIMQNLYTITKAIAYVFKQIQSRAQVGLGLKDTCLLYTSPSPRD